MTAYAYAHAYRLADCDARRNPAEPFEWEELPSLSNVLLRRRVPTGSNTLASELVAQARRHLDNEHAFAPVWADTRPCAFDPLLPSEPLRETELGGLDSREIVEPEVFRHFFGSAGR